MRLFKSLLLLGFLLAAPAYAVLSSGSSAFVDAVALSTSAYTQMFSSLAQPVKGFSIYNSAAKPLYLAFGSSGNEVNQVLIQPSSQTVYYPISASQGMRISLIASTGVPSSGAVYINALYN